jgi:nucleoside-diphosphate-sugar epimerase
MRVAITGGTGFIARGALDAFSRANIACRAISRSARPAWVASTVEWINVPSYDDLQALTRALAGVECVIHLAANPDRQASQSQNEPARYAAALIEAQRKSGAKRVIVASSIYARQGDAGASYGQAKRDVESQFLGAPDLEAIILRLPPVYGPGGKGGLPSLAKLVSKRLPLPLGAAHAPRAYLSRSNLVSLLVAMATASDTQWHDAAGKIFEPSDGSDISTADLVHAMASQLGVKPRLVSIPTSILRFAGRVTGKQDFVSGAFDPLQVAPMATIERAFGWRPVEQMPDSLRFLSDAQ